MDDTTLPGMGLQGYGFEDTFVLSMLLLGSQALLLGQQMLLQRTDALARPIWYYSTLQEAQDGVHAVIEDLQPALAHLEEDAGEES